MSIQDANSVKQAMPSDAQIPIIRKVGNREEIVGFWSVRKTKSWFDYLNQFFGLGRQITLDATLDFGPRAAQTSDELTSVFVWGVQSIKADSFLVFHRPLTYPANCEFSARMLADDVVCIRFNNYSAGIIDPGPLAFSVMIIPRI